MREATLEEAIKLGVPKADIVPVGKSVRDFVHENGLGDIIDTVADFVGMKQTFSDAQNIGKSEIFPFRKFIEGCVPNNKPVRYGGKILYVGTLSNETVIDPKICIKKRLTVLFNYGGQYQDVVEVLSLISRGIIRPQVENGKLQDFPQVLKSLHEGKIKSRIALIPSHARY